MSHPEHSRIAPLLPEVAQRMYLGAFQNGSLAQFENAFDSVLRFETDDRIRELKGEFRESDLHHTAEMLHIINGVETRCTYIPQEINLQVGRYFTIMHDIGEIITGDYPAVGEFRNTLNAVRAKKLEAYCAKMILRNIPDMSKRTYAIELLERYEKQQCPESRFIRFIDSVQGNQTAMRHIMNYTEKGMKKPDEWMVKHVRLALSKTCERALTVRRVLSYEAQGELDILVQENLREFQVQGYEALASGTFYHYEQTK